MKREFQIGLAVLAVITVVVLVYMFRRREHFESQAPPPPAEVNAALESLKVQFNACGSDQACIRELAFKMALNRAPV